MADDTSATLDLFHALVDARLAWKEAPRYRRHSTFGYRNYNGGYDKRLLDSID